MKDDPINTEEIDIKIERDVAMATAFQTGLLITLIISLLIDVA